MQYDESGSFHMGLFLLRVMVGSLPSEQPASLTMAFIRPFTAFCWFSLLFCTSLQPF